MNKTESANTFLVVGKLNKPGRWINPDRAIRVVPELKGTVMSVDDGSKCCLNCGGIDIDTNQGHYQFSTQTCMCYVLGKS